MTTIFDRALLLQIFSFKFWINIVLRLNINYGHARCRCFGFEWKVLKRIYYIFMKVCLSVCLCVGGLIDGGF
jgi:hypothetical protein